MSDCACPHCRPYDPDYRYTEAHRLDCEARKVMTWNLQTRREYLANVERMRGPQARQQLEQALASAWRSRKQTQTENEG